MDSLPIEKLLAKTGSIYKLVTLASRRASELVSGAPMLVDMIGEKVSTIALEEILQGKVWIKPDDSKEQRAKSKEQKNEDG